MDFRRVKVLEGKWEGIKVLREK
ncbi:hypothetical protein F383_04286 [Gossypium arboreum]|uniref:Uncharacterized protein n=1 Tax=Gossypium arboreum TaxID=29729 RepID=A0A0B0NDA6_GOSAR|nr:hypothetical protein F383_04286 [Gossypium arboreum]